MNAEIKHYRYVGVGPFLAAGETALGRVRPGTRIFEVQVDRFEHPWSHGWHETSICDWEPIE